MRTSAFWDLSALVPLCVLQRTTPRSIELYDLHHVVVWWATPVEIASALARLLRMGHLGPADWSKAGKLAKKLADSWSVMQPSDRLRARATQLVARFDLRAADSFQLASALEWCDDSPQGQVFLTADSKLVEAAILSGFDVPSLRS